MSKAPLTKVIAYNSNKPQRSNFNTLINAEESLVFADASSVNISNSFSQEQYKNVKEFIEKNILSQVGDMDSEIKKYFISENSIKKFMLCFITPLRNFNDKFNSNNTVTEVNNYELLEFNGDRVINNVIAEWSRKKYPLITNLGWIDQMNKHLKSSKCLEKIGNMMGLNTYNKNNIIKTGFFANNKKEYITPYIIDDIIEAIFGCIVNISCEYSLGFGIGMQIAYDILSKYLDKYSLEHRLDKIDTLWSKVELLREFYDILAWPAGFIVNKIDKDIKCTYYMWSTLNITNLRMKIQDATKFNNFTNQLVELANNNTNIRDKIMNNTALRDIIPLSQDYVKLYTSVSEIKSGKKKVSYNYYASAGEDRDVTEVTLSKAIIFLANTYLYGMGKKFAYNENRDNDPNDFTYYFGKGEIIGEYTQKGGDYFSAIDSAKNNACNLAIDMLVKSGYNITTMDKKLTYEYTRRDIAKGADNE